MTKRRQAYKTYTREFKLEALRLMRDSDKPASQIAVELGLRRNQLYKWAEQLEDKGEKAFCGQGRPRKAEQSPLSILEQENKKLREEVEILKKAAAYFARELK